MRKERKKVRKGLEEKVERSGSNITTGENNKRYSIL